MRTSLLNLAVFTMLTGSAFAHPGHGTTDPTTVSHQIIEPAHAVPWGMLGVAAIVSVGILANRFRGSRRRVVATTSRPKA